MASRKPTLPNLLIIGARKGGTTSLHNYLSYHPQIHMSKQKELSFFDENIRWKHGLDWYRGHFDASFPVNGESSPQYSRYPATLGVPERIKSVLGAPRLIYAIRDPVDRILSDYTQMLDYWMREPVGFEAILPNIENDREQYVQGSSYFLQLSQYLRHFPRENIHIVILERLNKNPKATLRETFRFLGVDEDFWSPVFDRRFNAGETKRTAARWFERAAPGFLKRQLLRPSWLPSRLVRAGRRLSQIGGEPIRKPKLTAEDDKRLQRILSADVKAFRDFLGDPLPEWRSYA